VRALPAVPASRGPKLTPRRGDGTAPPAAAAIAERVAETRARIAAAARRAGRDPAAVTLVAASKLQPVAAIEAARAAGVAVFGESRVQEALSKMQLLSGPIEWHFIGPLQTNKARAVVEAFSAVHSVDRLRLAEALDAAAHQFGRVLPCFLEVNLAGEPTKHGFAPSEVAPAVPRLAALAHLDLVGLMAVPPATEDPERSRPWFRALAELRDRVATAVLDLGRAPKVFAGLLSMGMSDDFEVAVEEGATHVRVGTALFGPRRVEAS
jgi:pyridoxal phosphate enzyme (YggS family)